MKIGSGFRRFFWCVGLVSIAVIHGSGASSGGERLRAKLGLPTDPASTRAQHFTANDVSALKQALAELDYESEPGWSRWSGYWKTQLLFIGGSQAFEQGRTQVAQKLLSNALDRVLQEKNPSWLRWTGLQAAVQVWQHAGKPQAAQSMLRRSLERLANWVPVASQERAMIPIHNAEIAAKTIREVDRFKDYSVALRSADQRALQGIVSEAVAVTPIGWKHLLGQLDAWLLLYPQSIDATRARYWRAQAYAHLGQPEKSGPEWRAIAVDFPLTYYGLLSAIALGRSVNEAIVADLPPLDRAEATSRVPESIWNATALSEAKRNAELAHEAWAVACRSSDFPTSVLLPSAALAFDAGAYRCSSSWLRELGRRVGPDARPVIEPSSWMVRRIFPAEAIEWMRPAERASGVEATLLVSLAKQESGLDPTAASSVGALGLTQVMPATAIEVDPTLQLQDLLVPEVNLRLGSTYLAGLLRRYQGKLPLALAAYNAGPGRTDAWVRQFGAGGDLLWIERVPYQETREYIQAILRNQAWFRVEAGEASTLVVENLRVP